MGTIGAPRLQRICTAVQSAIDATASGQGTLTGIKPGFESRAIADAIALPFIGLPLDLLKQSRSRSQPTNANRRRLLPLIYSANAASALRWRCTGLLSEAVSAVR